MHWLPLVAMVIASALLLLRCPSTPGLVAAQPGGHPAPADPSRPAPGPTHKRSRPPTPTVPPPDGGSEPGSLGGPVPAAPEGAAPLRPSGRSAHAEAPPTDLDLRPGDEQLLLDSHPRVFFSASAVPPRHPPLQLALESGPVPEDAEDEPGAGRAGESYRNLLLGRSGAARRRRRQLGHTGLERSVCEAVSAWVRDRRSAVDMFMQNVTVLEKFPSKKGMLTQYFYETRCRGPDHSGAARPGERGMAGGGCLGVDKRHWVSECQTKQTFVRAFTTDSVKGTGWRWIRIDSACVCVLYSRAHKNRLITAGRAGR